MQGRAHQVAETVAGREDDDAKTDDRHEQNQKRPQVFLLKFAEVAREANQSEQRGHHDYGIFLLAAVGGYSVFRRPTGRHAEITALMYGVAMGLTFDEFGMWLHLGGSYWQRASVDAVIVVAALFGLVGFARNLRKFEQKHLWSFVILLVAVIGFGVVIFVAGDRLGDLMGPTLHDLEAASSP